MKTTIPVLLIILLAQCLTPLLVTHFFTAARAAEVVIPDAALKSAIWETMGRPLPVGALNEQDMLSLKILEAYDKGVRSLKGLGAAHNLAMLDLRTERRS
jgi:hypothetical protein